MPEVKVKLRYLRIAPRKVRLVADLIRGKSALRAVALLNFCLKRAAPAIKKLVESGLAAAENDFRLQKDKLYIKEIKVDEGPKLKRWRPVSRGRAHMIEKKSSHITLVLDEVVLPSPGKEKAESGKESSKKK